MRRCGSHIQPAAVGRHPDEASASVPWRLTTKLGALTDLMSRPVIVCELITALLRLVTLLRRTPRG